MGKIDFDLPYTVFRIWRDDSDVEYCTELDFLWDDVVSLEEFPKEHGNWKKFIPGCMITFMRGDSVLVAEKKDEISVLWREYLQHISRPVYVFNKN